LSDTASDWHRFENADAAPQAKRTTKSRRVRVPGHKQCASIPQIEALEYIAGIGRTIFRQETRVGSVQQKSERNRGYQRRDSNVQGHKEHLTPDPPLLDWPSLENGGLGQRWKNGDIILITDDLMIDGDVAEPVHFADRLMHQIPE